MSSCLINKADLITGVVYTVVNKIIKSNYDVKIEGVRNIAEGILIPVVSRQIIENYPNVYGPLLQGYNNPLSYVDRYMIDLKKPLTDIILSIIERKVVYSEGIKKTLIEAGRLTFVSICVQKLT